MDFYWVGFVFWLLMGVGLVAFIIGLGKKSSRILIVSSLALLLPFLYFAGAENGFRYLALFPLVPFGIALFLKRKKTD